MKILIMGAGDLGAGYGATLQRAGEDVTFVARGQRLEALRTKGLIVRGKEGEPPLRVRAVSNPAEAGVVDLVLFCVKTYDLEEAAALVKPVVGPATVVIPVQNGVTARDRLAAILGPEPVLGGTEYGGIAFGEWDGALTPRARRIAEVFTSAGLKHRLVTNIEVVVWEKLIQAAAGNGALSLLGLSGHFAISDPDVAEFMRRIGEETFQVGKARGVNLPDDAVDRMMATARRVPSSYQGSMGRDFRAGRRLELEDHNGIVVRLGREHGVQTPLNFAVYTILKPFANGRAHSMRWES